MAKSNKMLSMALSGALLSCAAATATADVNPFQATPLASGYDLLNKAGAEGKCGEGKCGGDKKAAKEGKCGEKKAKREGKCGEDKAHDKKAGKEGKCGEGKCGEGKCGSK